MFSSRFKGSLRYTIDIINRNWHVRYNSFVHRLLTIHVRFFFIRSVNIRTCEVSSSWTIPRSDWNKMPMIIDRYHSIFLRKHDCFSFLCTFVCLSFIYVSKTTPSFTQKFVRFEIFRSVTKTMSTSKYTFRWRKDDLTHDCACSTISCTSTTLRTCTTRKQKK